MPDSEPSSDAGPSNAFLSLRDIMVPNAPSGPLAGLRLAVKDVLDVEGYPTGGGALDFSPRPERTTASCVRALLAAGAHFVGKTVTDELAFSLMGANDHFPRPRNWAAPTRFTGGSSCGSAAAVGANEADIALGTDTGGSIRAPASFCGLVGLRGTHGRIPTEGCLPLAPSFDTVGWFATSFAVYRQVAAVLEPEGKEEPRSWRPLRCGALDTLLTEPGTGAEFDRMALAVEDIVGRSEPFDLGAGPDDLAWAFRALQAVEAWAMHGPFVERSGRAMNPDVRQRFEWARTVTPAMFGKAMTLRSAFAAWMTDELGRDGLLVLPTVPGPAPLLGSDGAMLEDYRQGAVRLLAMAGLAGVPQLTLPLGTVDGAPFGLSLIGPHGSDGALLVLGERIMVELGATQAIASRYVAPSEATVDRGQALR